MPRTYQFPKTLHHQLPTWVDASGAVFRIRIRVAENNPIPLTNEIIASKLLDSVFEYARGKIWWPSLFLLMPDHIHALLSFNATRKMSRIVGDWKRWNQRKQGIIWQNNFFDHGLRRDESLEEKATYIRRNPVIKGLCSKPEDWAWVLDSKTLISKLIV